MASFLVAARPAAAVTALEGFHSAYVGQDPWPVISAGTTTAYSVRFRNIGTETWRRGVAGRQVNLGVVNDSLAFGDLAVGWMSQNRAATTVETTVAPGAIGTFLETAAQADLVLGSRYLGGSVTVVNWPLSRLILSYAANVYARWVTGLPIWDTTGGFKCFRRCALEAVPLDGVRSDGYAFQIEMTYKVWKRGFRIREIPITFVDRRAGVSKMNRGIVWEALWMVWRLRLGPKD